MKHTGKTVLVTDTQRTPERSKHKKCAVQHLDIASNSCILSAHCTQGLSKEKTTLKVCQVTHVSERHGVEKQWMFVARYLDLSLNESICQYNDINQQK